MSHTVRIVIETENTEEVLGILEGIVIRITEEGLEEQENFPLMDSAGEVIGEFIQTRKEDE